MYRSAMMRWSAVSMSRCFLLLCAGVLLASLATEASAAELRVLDGSGLVRAVRVVSKPAEVKVTIEGGQSPKGECIAANVDGLPSERKAPISPQGVCVFKELAAGTWQVTLPVKARWKVQINP